MDEIDLAQRHNEVFLADALARRRKTSGPSSRYCRECEAEIPEARRLAAPGCQLCISCQEIIELQER